MTKKQQRQQQQGKQLELPYPFGSALTDTDVWENCYSAQRWLSRKEIANLVGRKVTPGLVARIERLVEQRWLEREVRTARNGVQGYVYRALEDGE